MSDPTLWSATEQAAAIAAGSLSSRELTQAVIDRIERLDPHINAVVTRDFDRALRDADAADEAVAGGGPLGPLHGLPITVKDALETAGLRSTGGAVELKDNVPDRDAPVVTAVRRAGAIVIGKTNLPRWSGDIQSFNEIFGTTGNPWDTDRVPGGSSGGAAASVAMGFTSFEIGTDIGGSIRFPAAFNGVWGHKPSFGVVPSTGYLDHVRGGTTEADVNVIGPLARSADDLDLLLRILARNEPPWVAQLSPPVAEPSGMRVAAWLDDPFCPVDSEVSAVLDRAVKVLEDSGVTVDRDARPEVDPTEASDLGLWLVRCAIAQAGEGDGPGHRIWLDRHQRREEIRRKWAEFFEGYDAVIMPVAFVPPFPHDQEGDFGTRTLVANGESRPYRDVIRWTVLTGMAYLPATVPPLGLSSSGLPIGCQVVGPYGSDRSTIALAAHLGELMGGYTPPPLAVG
jgi:amidase